MISRSLFFAGLLISFSSAVLPAQSEGMATGIVGMSIKRLYDENAADKKGAMVVITVTPGYPAALAGISPGDVVSMIDGSPAREIGLPHDRIRGDVGSEVTLSIVRNDKTSTVLLRRVAANAPASAGLTAEQQALADALVKSALQKSIASVLQGNSGLAPSPNNTFTVTGEWHKVETDGYNTKETWLTLSADGTYSRIFKARLFGFGEVANEQVGRWTANGTSVRLSGDGKSPGSVENLATYSRGR